MSPSQKIIYHIDNKENYIIIGNLNTQKAIRFSTKFLNLMRFKNLVVQYQSAGMSFSKDTFKTFDVSIKTKLNTIYDGLIKIRAINDTLFNDFYKNLQYFDDSQVDLILSTLNNIVVAKHQVKLVAKSLTQIRASREGYWEEKYDFIAKLLEDGDWKLKGFEYSPEETYCELGHPIHRVVIIEDKNTGGLMQFGLDCINDVMNLDKESRNLLGSMFDTYRRTIVDYTFLLDEYISHPQFAKIQSLQYDVINILGKFVRTNKAISSGVFERQNKRREMAEDQIGISKQKYDTIMTLLQNGIPLPHPYQNELSQYSLEDSGIETLSRALTHIIPDKYIYIQYIYRLFLGLSMPHGLAPSDEQHYEKASAEDEDYLNLNGINLSNFPVATKDLEQMLGNYHYLRNLDAQYRFLTDEEYFNLLEKGANVREVLTNVMTFLQVISQGYEVSKDFKIITVQYRGFSRKVRPANLIRKLVGPTIPVVFGKNLLKLTADGQTKKYLDNSLNWDHGLTTNPSERPYILYDNLYKVATKLDKQRSSDMLSSLFAFNVIKALTDKGVGFGDEGSLFTQYVGLHIKELPTDFQRAWYDNKIDYILDSWGKKLESVGVKQKSKPFVPDWSSKQVKEVFADIFGYGLYYTIMNDPWAKPDEQIIKVLIRGMYKEYMAQQKFIQTHGDQRIFKNNSSNSNSNGFNAKAYYELTEIQPKPEESQVKELMHTLYTALDNPNYRDSAGTIDFQLARLVFDALGWGYLKMTKSDFGKTRFLREKALPSAENYGSLTANQWKYGGQDIKRIAQDYLKSK